MADLSVSVVTVHLDDFDGLSRTYLSLAELLLHSERLQWIVIDGGSQPLRASDRELLEAVARAADTYCSEPDRGIYDAMNKGTARARGDYLAYLNAGDEVHPEFSLGRLAEVAAEHRPDMIWGTCYERFPDGSLVRLKNRSPKLAWYGTPVNHQNALFRRDVLEAAPYDEQYRFCADYNLISRLLKQGGKVERTEMPIAIFQRGGTSARHFAETMKEEEVLRCVHYGVPRGLSKAITALKKLNHRAGSVPAVRRLMRKWV